MKKIIISLIVFCFVSFTKESLLGKILANQSRVKSSLLIDSLAFYVSPNGHDSNNGSLNYPFKTLERARDTMRSCTIKTVYLRLGEYARSQTFILDSNDNGQKWLNYPGDPINSAILNGNGIQDVIDILGGSDIIIEGLLVKNYTSRGIGVHGGKGWGNAAPYFNQTYSAAKNNIIRNNIVEAGIVPAPGWDRAGINTQGTVPNTQIINNVVRNTTGYGIGIWSLQAGDDISGTEVKNNALLNTCSTVNDGAAIYTNDRTAASTNVLIENNFIRDYGQFANFVRAVYLDDRASNTIVRGNIIAGTGRQPILLHGGNNNQVTGNIIDIGNSGKMSVLNYAISGTSTMTGNKFTGNIIISSYAIDSAGGAYLKTGTVTFPEIKYNYYYNYSTGIVNTGGLFYELKDSFPLQGDPKLSGWKYELSSTSPVFNNPTNFPPIVGHWGPPGYMIPAAGTAPSSLLPGSSHIYLHAESYASMNGIVKNGISIGSCDNNDWVRFENIDLSSNHNSFTARLAVPATHAGQKVQVRLDSPTGTLIGELTATDTGGFNNYVEQSTPLNGGVGIHNIYIVFSGGAGVGNFDYFKFH